MTLDDWTNTEYTVIVGVDDKLDLPDCPRNFEYDYYYMTGQSQWFQVKCKAYIVGT